MTRFTHLNLPSVNLLLHPKNPIQISVPDSSTSHSVPSDVFIPMPHSDDLRDHRQHITGSTTHTRIPSHNEIEAWMAGSRKKGSTKRKHTTRDTKLQEKEFIEALLREHIPQLEHMIHQARHMQAIDFMRAGLSHVKNKFPSPSHAVQIYLEMMADSFFEMQSYPLATAHAKQALAEAEKFVPIDQKRTGIAAITVARYLALEGKMDEAHTYVSTAYDHLRSASLTGAELVNQIKNLRAFAIDSLNRSRFDLARHWADQAIHWSQEAHPSQPLAIAWARFTLGDFIHRCAQKAHRSSNGSEVGSLVEHATEEYAVAIHEIGKIKNKDLKIDILTQWGHFFMPQLPIAIGTPHRPNSTLDSPELAYRCFETAERLVSKGKNANPIQALILKKHRAFAEFAASRHEHALQLLAEVERRMKKEAPKSEELLHLYQDLEKMALFLEQPQDAHLFRAKWTGFFTPSVAIDA